MIKAAEVGPEISAAGLLIGLLTQGSDAGTLNVDTGWFSDPIGALNGAGGRLSDLVALLGATLGAPADKGPDVFLNARWYSIPDPESGTPTVFQIVATDPSETSGQIGLGLLYTINLGAITGSAYAYIPLFSYSPSNGAELIIESLDDPCQIGLFITAPTPFEVLGGSDGTVTFTALNLVCHLFLNPSGYDNSPQLVKLVFENLTPNTLQNTYTTLSSLLDSDVEAWLLQVVVQSGAWLNTYLGDTPYTVGDVLEAMGILSRDYLFQSGNFTAVSSLAALLTASSPDPVSAFIWSQLPAADQSVLSDSSSTPDQQTAALVDGLNILIQAGASIYTQDRFANVTLSPGTIALIGQDPTGAALVRLNRMLLDNAYRAYIQPNPYALNLVNLKGSPAEIALNVLFGALNALSELGLPLIALPGGGIYITARTNDDQSQDFGLRLVLNLSLNANEPAGSTGPVVDLCLGTWLTGESDSGNWMTRSGGNAPSYPPGVSVFLLHRDSSRDVTFAPGFQLVSIGFNLSGAGNKPLVNLDGYGFSGTELRIFLFPGDPVLSVGDWQYGFAIRLDDVGFPLTPSAGTSAGGNPVASNLLSSGSGGGSGSDQEPVNPAFSAAVAWRSDSTLSPKANFQLFGTDGSATDTIWIPVQRSFGPLSCQKIGVSIDTSTPRLTILFDGGVILGPLEVDLIDLSVGVPLKAPLSLDQYALGLKGMAVSYSSGPLSIEGGMDEDTTVTPTEYNGSMSIQAASWSISAIGSYASLNGHPSLFVFARLGATIGGPAFFFVTGLCAGFGYNRSLQIPTQNEVPNFPLLSGIADPSSIGGSNPTPAEALQSLSKWVAPAQGVNWFAAGIQFTSFELVLSNVVLAVIVTGDFEAAILGISRSKLPQVGPVQFAYVELGIEIVLHPSAGFFGVSAVITDNSFVIDPACHLTGGFAFYVWFLKPEDGSADHSGDFVITLGGYHPSFTPPAWYPIEKRLGFSWIVSDQITIQGGAYFALTPSCVMGGGALDLEFHAGDLRAWFTAQADFLFHWKPFYFTGVVSVSIGASYRIDVGFCSFTVSVELGASLTIQGPPVAGRVTVDWYIISFSIPFGPDSSKPDAVIDWSDFSLMLPQNDTSRSQDSVAAPADTPLANVCKLTVGAGLSGTDTTSESTPLWLVRADTFTFTVQTAFPLTEADTTTDGATHIVLYPQATDPTPAVAVRPMAISSSNMSSKLLIYIQDSKTLEYQDLSKNWSCAANLGSVPAALWGQPSTSQPSAPSATLVPNNLVGLNQITPLPPTLTGPPEIPDLNLAFDTIDQTYSQFLPLAVGQSAIVPNITVSPTSLDTIAATVAAPEVVDTRNEVFAVLMNFGYFAGANGSTAELSSGVNFNYPDAPLLGAPWTNQ